MLGPCSGVWFLGKARGVLESMRFLLLGYLDSGCLWDDIDV